MKMKFDHDYHIHSTISACCSDERQTSDAMRKYAEDNNLVKICVTDHLWDSEVEGASPWYRPQNIESLKKILPLPKSGEFTFCFGCECELDKNNTLSLATKNFAQFDFIVIPTTHMHMKGLTAEEEDYDFPERFALHWINRLGAVLNKNLPFNKIGIAHLTCDCLAPNGLYMDVLKMISDNEMDYLFAKAASLGVGIEINYCDFQFKDEDAETILRPYRIAKKNGCKFYFGSDAHRIDVFSDAKNTFERAVDYLNLKESDKFSF